MSPNMLCHQHFTNPLFSQESPAPCPVYYYPSTQTSPTPSYRPRPRPGVLIKESEYLKEQDRMGMEFITEGIEHLSLQEQELVDVIMSDADTALRSILKMPGQHRVGSKKQTCFDAGVKCEDGGRPSRAFRLPKD